MIETRYYLRMGGESIDRAIKFGKGYKTYAAALVAMDNFVVYFEDVRIIKVDIEVLQFSKPNPVLKG